MDIPKKIYLQVVDCPNTANKEFSTWSLDRINENDIEYELTDDEALRIKELFDSGELDI